MKLFVDSNANQCVSGVNNRTGVQLQPFTYQDTVPLTIYALWGSTTSSAPYEVVPITGILQAGIAAIGSTTTAAFTDQFTATVDAAGLPVMVGSLYCGEPAFEALASTAAGALFCLRAVAGDGTINTLLQVGINTQTPAIIEATTITAPINLALPLLNNTAPSEGDTLTCSQGLWETKYGTIAYAYQWYSDTSPIDGASNASYVTQTSDVGHALRCAVTATNSAGAPTVYCVPTSMVGSLVPTNTVAPTISGTLGVEQTLTAAPGAWTGTPSYTYQWLRDITPISGATGGTYTLINSDVGSTLAVAVTGTNAHGTATAQSAPTAMVTSGAPVNRQKPNLDNQFPFIGDTIHCSEGVWNPAADSLAYQWYGNGVAISGATGTSYTVLSGDSGKTITCGVTPTSASGTGPEVITEFGYTGTLVPVMTGDTTPSGAVIASSAYGSTPAWLAFDGQTQTNGGWVSDGSPMPQWIGYQFPAATVVSSYSIFPCLLYDGGLRPPKDWTFEGSNDGTTWTVLDTRTNEPAWSSPVGRSYTFTNGAAFTSYRINVSATQGSGYVMIDELEMFAPAVVVAPIPVLMAGPTLSIEIPAVGDSVVCNPGAWLNTPAFTFQWQGNGSTLSGAASNAYTALSGDIGTALQCAVTATNANGAVTATSGATQAVASGVPAVIALPVIDTQAPIVGVTIRSTTGAWDRNPTSFGLQWYRGATAIESATGTAYTPVTGDIGSALTFGVVATNANGASAQAVSLPTSLVTATAAGGPVNTALPALTGIPAYIGATLVIGNGSWTGTPIAYAYQWYAGSTPLTGQTASSFHVGLSYAGGAISSGVVALTDTAGSDIAQSATVTVPSGLRAGWEFTSGTLSGTDFSCADVSGNAYTATVADVLGVMGGSGGLVPNLTFSPNASIGGGATTAMPLVIGTPLMVAARVVFSKYPAENNGSLVLFSATGISLKIAYGLDYPASWTVTFSVTSAEGTVSTITCTGTGAIDTTIIAWKNGILLGLSVGAGAPVYGVASGTFAVDRAPVTLGTVWVAEVISGPSPWNIPRMAFWNRILGSAERAALLNW